jgi:voltage-gated potassium channel Kch
MKERGIFTIFMGFFLLIISVGIKNKSTLAWYVIVIFLVLSIFVILLKGITIYYIDLLVIGFDIYILVLLLLHKREFNYPLRFFYRPEISIAIVLIIFTISYGIGGSLLFGSQFSPAIRDFYTALYYTIETVTTLGFGDILPITTVSRMFTVSLAVMGLASFFGAVTILVAPIFQKRVSEVINIMEHFETKNFKNHIVVCGYSAIILDFLENLKDHDKLLMIIEKNIENATMLRNKGFIVINDNADNDRLLKTLNLEFAQKILIASDNDGYNLLIAITIKQLDFANKLKEKTIIIINDSKNYNKFKDFSDSIVDPNSIFKNYISKMI